MPDAIWAGLKMTAPLERSFGNFRHEKNTDSLFESL
jgi:hypothetical protein